MRYRQSDGAQAPTLKNESAQSILNAATTLFLEKGYNDVTTRNIAALAEVNLGLIPYYFSSKEALAKQVCLNILDQLSIDSLEHLDGFTSAEKMYISSVILWRALEADPPAARFYYEFVESSDALDTYSASFIACSWNTIQDFRLNVSEYENALYLTVMKATERVLVIRYHKKTLNITIEDIVELLTSNYFFNIGIPDKDIASIIEVSRNYCRKTTGA